MKFWPFKSKAARLQEELDKTNQELARVKNESGTFSITDADAWFEIVHGGRPTSGAVTNPDTAMRTSAVYSCVRLISTAVSCSPVKIYKRRGDLRQRAERHSLEDMLRIRPNRFMTAATFWKAFMYDKLLQGNAYAVIERNRRGEPVALFPVRAQNAKVYFAWELGVDKQAGKERNRLMYVFTFPDGNQRLYDQEDVLHVPNVGWNGKNGISTVRAMAQSVGLALSAEKSAASFFENGMQSQLSISIPGSPDPEVLERLREHLKERYSGAGNHYKPLVLTGDGKASTLSMTAEDAQLLECRNFSVIDICRFFGVHPVMVGENEKTSSFGGGIEQMGRWFNTLTLNEHFTAIEQELEAKLFRFDGNFAEFDESEITRGDTKARAEYFKAAIGGTQNAGWLTINEVRAAEGYAPLPGGDEITKPEPATPSQPPAEQGGQQ